MNLFSITWIMLFVSGGIAAFISLIRYSDFLKRLHLVDGSLTDKWAMDMNGGEGWSRKDAAVYISFWQREYLSIPDKELHKLGNSVLKAQTAALLFSIGGILVHTFVDILVK